jgi:Transposase DDE domain
MSIIRNVAATLQILLGPSLDQIGRQTGVIRRQRKFSGMTLLKALVLTLLKSPKADTDKYAKTAAKLGVIVTPEAVQKRFSPRLVTFLKAVLQQAIEKVVASQPVAIELLRKFTAVRVGDSTSITLPDEFADEFPGCGGTGDYGKAALKIQLLWDLLTGELVTLDLEPGRRSDAKGVLLEGPVPAGSLSIFDLGYFWLDRFAELIGYGAYWISRWQQGTAAFDRDGRPLDLLRDVREHTGTWPIDIPIQLGAGHRLACRLIVLRVPQEVAARRRQAASEKARKHGRTASQDQLAWCDWAVFVTNCSEELLTWKEVVVLYRARWQIELMFKLWKSHGQLDKHRTARPAEWQMAELLAKLIGVIVQHWLLLSSTWANPRRSLWKAAGVIREWIDILAESLNDLDRLEDALMRMKAAVEAVAKVDLRSKHPSSFQLLGNPDLLDYTP